MSLFFLVYLTLSIYGFNIQPLFSREKFRLCQTDGYFDNGYCYKTFFEEKPWNEANEIWRIFSDTTEPIWIGLSRESVSDDFLWVTTGKKPNSEYWDSPNAYPSNLPEDNCVQLTHEERWQNVACNETNNFICSVPFTNGAENFFTNYFVESLIVGGGFILLIVSMCTICVISTLCVGLCNKKRSLTAQKDMEMNFFGIFNKYKKESRHVFVSPENTSTSTESITIPHFELKNLGEELKSEEGGPLWVSLCPGEGDVIKVSIYERVEFTAPKSKRPFVDISTATWRNRLTTHRVLFKNYSVTEKYFKFSDKLMRRAVNEMEMKTKLFMSLKHPNINPVLGCVKKSSVEFGIVSTLCVRGSLEQHLVHQKKMGYSVNFLQKIAWLVKIVEALEYMHDNEVYHHALSLRNILVSKEKELKVDFSLQYELLKFLKKKVSFEKYEEDYFLAPEIIKNEKIHNHRRCDTFSFSFIMYELLTESFDPFKDFEMQERSNHTFAPKKDSYRASRVSLRIANDPIFRPPVRDQEHIDEFVLDLMKQCWDPDAPKRPPLHLVRDCLSEFLK